MSHRSQQSGFSAIELLITLFVAAAFIIAGYQLYNVIIKDGGNTRAETRAANVAYDYLRRYTTSAATNPCTVGSPLGATGSDVAVSGLSAVNVRVEVSCPYASTTNAASISEVEVTIRYNNPQKVLKYATFATGSASPQITSGLVGWWKMNGNGTDSSGFGRNATPVSTSTVVGQNGQPNTAYGFSGTAHLQLPGGFANFSTGITMSIWANPTSNGSYARFFDLANGPDADNIVMARAGTTTSVYYRPYPGSSLIITDGMYLNGWHHYVVTQNTSGLTTFYIDGVNRGSLTTPLPPNVNRSTNYIGRSNFVADSYFAGSMDDARIYNRALSADEVSKVYKAGAQ